MLIPKSWGDFAQYWFPKSDFEDQYCAFFLISLKIKQPAATPIKLPSVAVGCSFVCIINYKIVSPSPYELRPASMMLWLLSPL